MKKIFFLALFFSSLNNFYGQKMSIVAEKIRKEYQIPELAYAVVSSDSILELTL